MFSFCFFLFGNFLPFVAETIMTIPKRDKRCSPRGEEDCTWLLLSYLGFFLLGRADTETWLGGVRG